MNHRFLQYDKKTGRYLGTRLTSNRYPKWSEGLQGVYTGGIDDKNKVDIINNPETYKFKNNKFIPVGGRSEKVATLTTIKNPKVVNKK